MTTTHTTPLPFLLPAANLAAGDTLYSGAVIDARETAPGGKIHVTLLDGTVLEPLDPDELVQVQPRRPIQVLRDMAAAFTDLASEWVLQAAALRGEAGRLDDFDPAGKIARKRADTYHENAKQVRALLARLGG